MIKIFTVVIVVISGLVGSSAWAINLPIKPLETAPAVNRPVPPVNAVKSFREWKNEKVQAAIKRVTITKAQIEYRKLNKQFLYKNTEANKAKDTELERLEALLKSDLYALDAAQELGVADYFAGHLTIQDNKTEAYKLAAEKMTSDEVNQLIKAYADSMFTTQTTGAPGTKVGPTAMEKTELSK